MRSDLSVSFILVIRRMDCFIQHVVHRITLLQRCLICFLANLCNFTSVNISGFLRSYEFIFQVISNKGYDGAKADLWSCGVILFVLMAGFLPFEETNLVALYKKVFFCRCMVFCHGCLEFFKSQHFEGNCSEKLTWA